MRALCRLLYRCLPASVCTIAACNSWAQRIGRACLSRKDGIYQGDYGLKLKLTPEEAMKTGIVYLGTMNLLETRLIKQYLKPDDTFVDVGTYIDGWHALVASVIARKVYAFEPIPEYFRRFQEQVKLNYMQGVICAENMALSDCNGILRFERRGAESRQAPVGVAVEAMTLDSYVANRKINRVDFLKIDVEGFEKEVLYGARNTIQNMVKHILLEVLPGVQPPVIPGFTAFRITRDGLAPWKPSEIQNVFYIRDGMSAS